MPVSPTVFAEPHTTASSSYGIMALAVGCFAFHHHLTVQVRVERGGAAESRPFPAPHEDSSLSFHWVGIARLTCSGRWRSSCRIDAVPSRHTTYETGEHCSTFPRYTRRLSEWCETLAANCTHYTLHNDTNFGQRNALNFARF